MPHPDNQSFSRLIGQTEAPSGEVFEHVEILLYIADSIAERVEQLRVRLAPVSRPTTESASRSQPTQLPETEVARKMFEVGERLRNTQLALQKIDRALELPGGSPALSFL
ncbi:hypothetical protein [Bordetella flabilis]|uniref:Uncharacterized protein n=1 Tax=Bordetella flabilis TaxID=463014 RepID=A0A193G9X5_9BORD|nr:hypothetical protein [Bordetella flabilis]ANN76792.1 hypothetical protein BAU07_06405 [Bordetella flabilis]